MITSHTNLLKQLHEYVNEYVAYLGDRSSVVTPEANDNLRRIISDLEELQKHPEQPRKTAQVAEGICDQLDRLRQLRGQGRRSGTLPRPHRTLMQSFQDYIESEVNYLAQVGSHPKREQINLLLGDIISDLNALSLHPTEEQAEQLAADLERKREQIDKLDRPWQQIHER